MPGILGAIVFVVGAVDSLGRLHELIPEGARLLVVVAGTLIWYAYLGTRVALRVDRLESAVAGLTPRPPASSQELLAEGLTALSGQFRELWKQGRVAISSVDFGDWLARSERAVEGLPDHPFVLKLPPDLRERVRAPFDARSLPPLVTASLHGVGAFPRARQDAMRVKRVLEQLWYRSDQLRRVRDEFVARHGIQIADSQS